MYEIDLLQGEGVPIRSRPGGIAFACMIIAVPLILGAAMVTIYLEHHVAVSVQSQQLTRLHQAVAALAPALEAQKSHGVHVLADVKTALAGYTQWSPILGTVIDCLPRGLILTKLGATQNVVQRQVPDRSDPEKTTAVSVPVCALQICVAGHDEDVAYRAVREFQDRLRGSAGLGSRIDALRVSQESQTLDGQSAVSYELNCTFKPLW
jgi:hypothetical protein